MSRRPTFLLGLRAPFFDTARDASNPIFVRANTFNTDAALRRKRRRTRFLCTNISSWKDFGGDGLLTAQEGRSFNPSPWAAQRLTKVAAQVASMYFILVDPDGVRLYVLKNCCTEISCQRMDGSTIGCRVSTYIRGTFKVNSSATLGLDCTWL